MQCWHFLTREKKMHPLIEFVDEKTKILESEYREIDPEFKKIPDYRRPRIYSNSNKRIFYSLHGFLGTPEEMTVNDEVLKNLGFDIYHDLVPGFGSHPPICNDYRSEDWLNDFKEKLDFLMKNYDEIFLSGFSTGALIIHSFLRSGEGSIAMPKIKGLLFFSPFYLPTLKLARPVVKNSSFLIKTFSLQWLYRLTGIQDLQVILFKPQYYLQRIPLLTALQINDLGREVFNSTLSEKIKAPILVFLTRVDKVANPQISEQMIKRDFANFQIKIFDNPQIPHHLMVPEVNPEIDQLKDRSRAFISSLLG